MEKTPRRPPFAGPYLSNPSFPSHKSKTLRNKVLQAFQGHQDHRKPTLGATSIVREKIDQNKKNVPKICRIFSSRTTVFVRRVFPTRYKLIHKLENLRKTTTPTTTCNSRFASNISRLVRIFTGKMQKNSSDALTSRSHNFFVRTPIHTNLISLESRLLKISNGTMYDPFWTPEGPNKLPRKPGKKKNCIGTQIEEDLSEVPLGK